MNRLLRSTPFWVCCFLLLILICTGILLFRRERASGTVATITREGCELHRIDLSAVTEPYTLRVDHGDGGYNLVLVEPGQIRIIEASCPDKVCIQQGAIAHSLTPIVCLPNQLVIAVEQPPEELLTDAAVG